MLEPEILHLFVRPLNAAGIRYIVGGSVAATFYAEPRFTHDIDLVVFLTDRDAARFHKIYPGKDFYVPPVETIQSEIRRENGGHFNLIHTETGFKADFFLSGRDKLNAWGFRLRRQIEFEGVSMSVAPPEYVIVRKLEYYREGGSEKHLRDIKSICAMSGSDLDEASLQEWIAKLGLDNEWQKALK
jgi:hypothetical protein